MAGKAVDRSWIGAHLSLQFIPWAIVAVLAHKIPGSLFMFGSGHGLEYPKIVQHEEGAHLENNLAKTHRALNRTSSEPLHLKDVAELPGPIAANDIRYHIEEDKSNSRGDMIIKRSTNVSVEDPCQVEVENSKESEQSTSDRNATRYTPGNYGATGQLDSRTTYLPSMPDIRPIILPLL
eukprot:5153792-Amphidinium_carterae.1